MTRTALVQRPMFDPSSDWRPPKVTNLPTWAGAARVAIDTETCDPELKKLGPGVRRGGYMVGVSFAIEGGPAAYLPFGHVGGDNLSREMVLQYLRDQAAAFKGEIVGANLQYDLDYLAEVGVSFTPTCFRDVQVAEPLIDELPFDFSLDAIAARHGLAGKSEEHLKNAADAWGLDAKAGLYKLPARHVGVYAEEDARLPLALLRKQEAILSKDERLWELWNLESRLLPVLLKMRRHGVRISHKRLDKVETWAQGERATALSELSKLTGVAFGAGDLNKARAVGKMFAAVGVELPKTPTGEPCTRDEVLKAIDHPVGKVLNRAKKFDKLVGTFAKSVRTHAIGDRVHCTFNQLKRESDDGDDTRGTITGRLSSSNFNLQQQPGKDEEIAPLWRSIYLPDEGGRWAANDFSQQEPRWLVHFAELCGCSRAKEAADRYRKDPSTDNHDMMTQLIHGEVAFAAWDKDTRKHHRGVAKIIFLALCYSMGGAKLCRKLGLPTRWKNIRGRDIEMAGEEGAELLRSFNEKVPFIRDLSGKAQDFASRSGYLRTVLGRCLHFPRLPSGSFDELHKALNKLIQGSSADQTKKAMVDADAAGLLLQLQAHDELGQTVSSKKEAKALAEIMVNAVHCGVPHKVDVEIGPSWGEAK